LSCFSAARSAKRLACLWIVGLLSTINLVVVTSKETEIVIIIGFFDVLASAKAAFGAGEWSPHYHVV
jgi:hypothetical protein